MSRTAATYNMTVTRGATWEDEFTYTDDAGVAINLTGYEARMQIRELGDAFGLTTTPVLTLTTTGVTPLLVWDTAANGRLRVEASPTQHTLLNPLNLRRVKYAYSIEVYTTSPEYVLPFVTGKITVKGEVTR